MAEQPHMTPEEAQAFLCNEVRHIRNQVDTIRKWVVFGGVFLLISIVVSLLFAACSAIFTLG